MTSSSNSMTSAVRCRHLEVVRAMEVPTTQGPATAPPTSDGVGDCFYQVLQAHQPWAPSSRLWLRGLTALKVGAASSCRFSHDQDVGHLGIPDAWISASHCSLQSLYGRWTLRDEGSKNGTFVNGSPAAHRVLQDGDVIQLGRTFFLYRHRVPRLAPLAGHLEQSDRLQAPLPQLMTWVPSLAQQF